MVYKIYYVSFTKLFNRCLTHLASGLWANVEESSADGVIGNDGAEGPEAVYVGHCGEVHPLQQLGSSTYAE